MPTKENQRWQSGDSQKNLLTKLDEAFPISESKYLCRIQRTKRFEKDSCYYTENERLLCSATSHLPINWIAYEKQRLRLSPEIGQVEK